MDQVVCVVEASYWMETIRYLQATFGGWTNVKLPEKGRIYTIRSSEHRCDPGCNNPDCGPWFLLAEIVNAPEIISATGRKEEPHFHAIGFRPVKKTSIEVFRQIAVDLTAKTRLPEKVS